MKLDIKNNFKALFSLKHFWVYMFIFAVITTVSSVIQSSNMHYGSQISSLISILSYISLGYLFIMVHKIINNKPENEEENFKTNFIESAKRGFMALVGIISNLFILILTDVIIMFFSIVGYYFFTKKLLKMSELFTVKPLLFILLVIAVFTVFAIILISHILPVVFSYNYSIRNMFKWRKIFNVFFKNGYAVKTFSVLGFYFVTLITIVCVLFVVTFIFNFLALFFAKFLLETHYIALAFLINLSNVFVPFAVATLNFILSAMTFRMFANIFKEQLIDGNIG